VRGIDGLSMIIRLFKCVSFMHVDVKTLGSCSNELFCTLREKKTNTLYNSRNEMVIIIIFMSVYVIGTTARSLYEC